MKLKRFVNFILFSLIFQSCLFGDNPSGTTRVEKDFCTTWFENNSNLSLIKVDEDKISGNGAIIIEKTIFAIGSNENFIIVKQHENKKKEIIEKLNQRKNVYQGEYVYLLPELKDTIWLSETDSILKIGSRWYHKKMLWESDLHDSLKTYKNIIKYHIVDIRNYRRSDFNSFRLYSFDNELDFQRKRFELNVNDTLGFEIVNP